MTEDRSAHGPPVAAEVAARSSGADWAAVRVRLETSSARKVLVPQAREELEEQLRDATEEDEDEEEEVP